MKGVKRLDPRIVVTPIKLQSVLGGKEWAKDWEEVRKMLTISRLMGTSVSLMSMTLAELKTCGTD